MNDNIKAALTDFVNLTEEEWSVFSATLVTKQYKKGDYFLKENTQWVFDQNINFLTFDVDVDL